LVRRLLVIIVIIVTATGPGIERLIRLRGGRWRCACDWLLARLRLRLLRRFGCSGLLLLVDGRRLLARSFRLSSRLLLLLTLGFRPGGSLLLFLALCFRPGGGLLGGLLGRGLLGGSLRGLLGRHGCCLLRGLRGSLCGSLRGRFRRSSRGRLLRRQSCGSLLCGFRGCFGSSLGRGLPLLLGVLRGAEWSRCKNRRDQDCAEDGGKNLGRLFGE
jgi:hypothetical protein